MKVIPETHRAQKFEIRTLNNLHSHLSLKTVSIINSHVEKNDNL